MASNMAAQTLKKDGNQFWAGLLSDLVIEQRLMRSLKMSGGLTRGTGLTEEQRSDHFPVQPCHAGIQ